MVLWARWGFHKAALAELRHRATMDTLVSLGTLAQHGGWSVVLLAGDPAGEPAGHVYFERSRPCWWC